MFRLQAILLVILSLCLSTVNAGFLAALVDYRASRRSLFTGGNKGDHSTCLAKGSFQPPAIETSES